MECFISTLLLLALAPTCLATFDLNPLQIQMVADHLSLSECRKLSESLHEDGFVRSHEPSGKLEPKGVSCMSLLEHWNTHEGKQKSFHLLATRLRQLGKNDLADRLAKSVTEEKISEVQETFLSDPFKESHNKISLLLGGKPNIQVPLNEPEEVKGWTTFEELEVVGLALIGLVFLFLILMFLVKCFLPDSLARMRTSFYLAFTDKRPGNEDLFFCC